MLSVTERTALTAVSRVVARPQPSSLAFRRASAVKSHKRELHTSNQRRAIDPATAWAAGACAVAGAGATGYWIMSRVHIAKPNQFIIKTGIGIDDVDISKKTVQWPFQKVFFGANIFYQI
jgi:hypothetical protein